MKKLPIRLNRRRIEAFCKKNHIIYLALFGSILTSKFNKESDVDILVKFEKKHVPHLFKMAGLEIELSELLGRTVDLRTPFDLSVHFRDDVLSSAKVIYGD